MRDVSTGAGPDVGWGIVGAGRIAETFLEGLSRVPGGVLRAVYTRDSAGRNALAEREGARVHTDLGAFVADSEIDLVYVANPHPFHHRAALAVIGGGKGLLVEKPMAMNSTQTSEIVQAARVASVPLLEAMWTAYLPQSTAIEQMIADGRIGAVREVRAAHLQWLPESVSARLHRPELGGGALLDLGVYPLTFAQMWLGSPTSISATGTMSEYGVDHTVETVAKYGSGAVARTISSSMQAGECDASIVGEHGRIDLASVFYGPTQVRLTDQDGRVEEHDFRQGERSHDFAPEIAEAQRVLRAGEAESPRCPWSQTLAVMSTMDDVRAQLGVRYDVYGEPR